MLGRHFDPDRREMMAVVLKAVQAPSAEAGFFFFFNSAKVHLFISFSFLGATMSKLDDWCYYCKLFNWIILCDFLPSNSSKGGHISGNTHSKTTLLSRFDIVSFQCLAANYFLVSLKANS